MGEQILSEQVSIQEIKGAKMTIDWMNPSPEVMEAKDVGYAEGRESLQEELQEMTSSAESYEKLYVEEIRKREAVEAEVARINARSQSSSSEKADLDTLVDDVSVCGVCGSVNQCQYCGHCSKCSHIKVESVEAEMKRYKDRLQFDPGGSDKIDELEQAMQFSRHAFKEAEGKYKPALEALHQIEEIESREVCSVCKGRGDTHEQDGEFGRECSVCSGTGWASEEARKLRAHYEVLVAELVRAQAANERDRQIVHKGVHLIKGAISRRVWLRSSRGSYDCDDERYQEEFSTALDEIRAAMEPLESIAKDLSDCPGSRQQGLDFQWQASYSDDDLKFRCDRLRLAAISDMLNRGEIPDIETVIDLVKDLEAVLRARLVG